MASEKTPLVSSTSSGNGGGQPPILDGVQQRSSVGDVSIDTTFSRAEGYEEVDNMPKGGVAEEFYPRPVLERRGNTDFTGREADGSNKKQHSMKMPSLGGGGILDFIGRDSWTQISRRASGSGFSVAPAPPTMEDEDINTGEIGTLLIKRKVPIKVEPKVHFANERTFLAWLHVVVILAVASMTIVTYGQDESIVNQLYGIVLLPVSVAYTFYALWQYLNRSYMIKNREPGPYLDVMGPVTLTIILMASIIAQFCAKIHAMVNE